MSNNAWCIGYWIFDNFRSLHAKSDEKPAFVMHDIIRNMTEGLTDESKVEALEFALTYAARHIAASRLDNTI